MADCRSVWPTLPAALVLCGLSLPAAANDMVAREVEAQVRNGPLHGTMLGPAVADGRPAVIIIPGSGPTDRDGNNPLGVAAAQYRMLAEALAAEGVASIRTDKRGMFASTGSFADPNAVTFADYAGDAWAWIATARRETGAGCAWLLGHSEGGLTALVAAARTDPALCGLILVAAPGRRPGDVLRDQLRSNPANWPILHQALPAVSALERGEKVDVSGFHEALQGLFAPEIQDFLIDLFSHDPVLLIAACHRPVLVVQGGNDFQVKRIDAEKLAQAQPAAELVLLADMNHVLKAVPAGDPAANYAAYLDPDLPLAPGLADAIAAFVTRAR